MALHRDAYGRLWRDCETCDGTGRRTVERDVSHGDYMEAVEYEVSCDDCAPENERRCGVDA